MRIVATPTLASLKEIYGRVNPDFSFFLKKSSVRKEAGNSLFFNNKISQEDHVL